MNWSFKQEQLRGLMESVLGEKKIQQLGASVENSHFLPGTMSKEDQPADASSKAVLKNAGGKAVGFLICSNLKNPDLVARNVRKAREARSLLDHRLGNVILMPLLEGRFDGLSWAVFPMKRTLAENKWKWRWQKLRLSPLVAGWLTAVTAHTQRAFPSGNHRVEAALASLSQDGSFSSEIRSKAKAAIDRFHEGRWEPRAVLAHNDLWKGNILLPEPSSADPDPARFYVIDWAGSNTLGFPFFDLMRLAISLKFPSFYTRRLVAKHCRILECRLEDAIFYLLASLGDLGRHLENFPRHRYVAMAMEVYTTLTKIVGG